MIEEETLRAICLALRNGDVVDFVRASVRTGYRECLAAPVEAIDRLVEDAIGALARSQEDAVDPERLVAATSALLEETFRKGDGAFWFNREYRRYKTERKPEDDLRQFRALISGETVLDYGCGGGNLAARLADAGYHVLTADVLDYRYDAARRLPFLRMSSPSDIPYPEDSVDTALVQAVLHHVSTDELPAVVRRLGRVARTILIKEDTYDVPLDLAGVAETIAAQPLLASFVGLPRDAQFQALVLIDFYANAVAQGVPEMNMPFGFRSVREWERLLNANGLDVTRVLVTGFEAGRMHKSCHVLLRCDRARSSA